MADPWQTLSSNMFSLPGVMSAASDARKSRLQEMMLGRQMAQEEKTSAAREKATSMYRSGDRKGARDEAMAGGAYNLAEALDKMDTAEQERVKQRLSLVGEAALWADTPEKWDQSIDYLVEAGHPDLAQYRGKFSPAARQAAIAAAGQSKEFFERNKPVLMGPGYEMRNPSDGSLIAKTPFAPWRQTLSPGQTLVGGQETGEQGLPPDDIFARMLHTESRGRQFGANGQPLTSPAGAIGIAQVMPGTAPEAARLAGLPFDDNRYRNDPEYNQALGRAYFEKQLADFGDPEKAVAAYNAGPGGVQRAVQKGGENWKNYLPAETKGYLQSVFGAAPGGGMRVLATGAPKPTWQDMTPDQVKQAGLPPGAYQRGPDGQIKPVATPKGADPAAGTPAYSQSAMDAFDRAIGTATRLLDHPGFNAAVGMPSINPLDGNLAGFIVSGTPAADFRAELDAMKAQVFLPMVQSMKGMGALSNAEGQKLTDAIGALDPRMSEGAFRSSLNRVIADLNTYKARAVAPSANAAAAAPSGQRVRKFNPATGKIE